jgi:hypothetical protein
MSQIALYQVLRSLGVDDGKAREAVEQNELVTKDYLKGELEAMRNSLLLWLFTMLFAYSSIIIGAMAGLLKWMKS